MTASHCCEVDICHKSGRKNGLKTAFCSELRHLAHPVLKRRLIGLAVRVLIPLGARHAKCVSAKDAYALIEIMIAGGLLAFFVFSIYTAFSFGFATIKVS